ncbi:MAG: hypothetical protein R3C70_01440 [Geminicoccaceae bacterium]
MASLLLSKLVVYVIAYISSSAFNTPSAVSDGAPIIGPDGVVESGNDTEDRVTKPERGKRGRKARRPQATSGTLRDLFGAAGVTLPARRSVDTDKGGRSYQQGKGTPKGADPRGSITFAEGRTLIRLFEKADLSIDVSPFG